MLRLVKACNFWQKKPFLLTLKEIGKEKVYLSLLPQDEEHELISQPGVERIQPQIEGSLGAVKALGRNYEDVSTGIGASYEGIGLIGGQMEEEKKDAQGEMEASANGKRLKKVVRIVIKQSEQIAALDKKVVKLERLAASKGWNLEGTHDPDNLLEHKDGEVEAEVDEQAIDVLIGTIYDSCMDERVNNHTIENGVYIQPGRNGPSNKKNVMGVACQEEIGAMLSCIIRAVQIEPQKNGKIKKPITEEQLMFKRKRGFPKEAVGRHRLARVEQKDLDMLVNLDDYASPADHKKEKAEPLSYFGRELITEDEKIYLDAFCGKPVQRDDIVFFNWNIIIRRQSMVQYLQGGCTGEEIIDAYARILDERANMHGSNFASFLYVPPMFLGLYRNKLGSYKTFLNTVNTKSLEEAKFLFLPCHISSGHWLLLVCDMDTRKWKVFDSLYDPRHREVAKEQMMLLTQYLFLDHNFDIRSWSLEYRRVHPQQEPGTLDCGVFVMMFMETIISIPREITFQAADMRLFRPRIAYQILSHG
ncbi:hypothetical protein HPP92_015234 [Vanilla planifolia]|uniref:Ubiquitin-like protease family profile domain-containing protein n=1 Tax=Vanilla planifolia TaxID=51239 RepID=A0A835QW24_VANPL|nr:hypothetical protein HPP92_015234 [Vanilla planifolia]